MFNSNTHMFFPGAPGQPPLAMPPPSSHSPVQVGLTQQSPPSYEAIVLDPNGPRSQTNLFVRKLASAVTEQDMQGLFTPFGTIVSSALMRDIHSGESLGTAFVRYETHEQAKRAMAELDGRELYGRPISIQWAKKQHDGTPIGEARRKIHKLFVRNIPLDVTARRLRMLFSPYGSISNVTLHSDTAPVPMDSGKAQPERNIAFILFHDDGAAEHAVKALHNACPFPSCEGIPLMVKLAEDNRQRLERRQKYGENGSTTMLTPSAPGIVPTQSLTMVSSTDSQVPPVLSSLNGSPFTTGLSPHIPLIGAGGPTSNAFPIFPPQNAFFFPAPQLSAAPGTPPAAGAPATLLDAASLANLAALQPHYFPTTFVPGLDAGTAAAMLQQQQQLFLQQQSAMLSAMQQQQQHLQQLHHQQQQQQQQQQDPQQGGSEKNGTPTPSPSSTSLSLTTTPQASTTPLQPTNGLQILSQMSSPFQIALNGLQPLGSQDSTSMALPNGGDTMQARGSPGVIAPTASQPHGDSADDFDEEAELMTLTHHLVAEFCSRNQNNADDASSYPHTIAADNVVGFKPSNAKSGMSVLSGLQ